MAMTDTMPALDPFSFPNYSQENTWNGMAFIFYGLTFYEVVMCLNTYASVFSWAKMKTTIFRTITVAVFSLILATVILVILQFNLTRNDLVLPPGEYELRMASFVLLDLAKVAYYIAGMLRANALLKTFPKIRCFLYMMMTICVVGNQILLGLLISLANAQVLTPETMFTSIPKILDIIMQYTVVASVVSIFDMVFANILIVSFLHPIFSALNLSFGPAFIEMFRLGTVQKALVASISSILFVAFSYGIPNNVDMAIAVLTLWMHTQNSQFLYLSYLNTTELFTKHSLQSRTPSRSEPKRSITATSSMV